VLWVTGEEDADGALRDLPYRKVQVLAHVDGDKTPMDVAAASPFSPTETLRILCDLAAAGVVAWKGHAPEKPLARLVLFPVPDAAVSVEAVRPPSAGVGNERRKPRAV
jgi:hypothetical protein